MQAKWDAVCCADGRVLRIVLRGRLLVVALSSYLDTLVLININGSGSLRVEIGGVMMAGRDVSSVLVSTIIRFMVGGGGGVKTVKMKRIHGKCLY